MNNPYQPPGSELEAPHQGAITATMLTYLKQTRPWVFLFSILGFIFSALMVIVGIGMVVLVLVGAMGTGDFPVEGFGGVGGVAIGIVYGILGLIYLPPTIYLFRFTRAINRVIAGGGSEALETALLHQKSFWKFLGLFTIIMIILYFLGIAAAIVIPLLAM